MYVIKESSHLLVRSTWIVAAEYGEQYVDPANEFWSLAFIKRSKGEFSASLIGPSLTPRILKGKEGEQYWGVELQPHVFVKGLEKPSTAEAVVPILVTNRHVLLGGREYPIPYYSQLEKFVEQLEHDQVIRSDLRILRSLEGKEKGFSSRSRQRYFKKVTGLSKKQILQLQRARHASRLLQQGLSLADVALLAGYTDQAHLTHSLKRHYAATPAEIAVRR